MRLIENINDDAYQRHVVSFDELEIILELRFIQPANVWVVNVTYRSRSIFGFKLSVGVLHFRSQNLPFDFYVDDNSGSGLDPFRRDDFSSGRCSLYLFDVADMEALRGGPVPI